MMMMGLQVSANDGVETPPIQLNEDEEVCAKLMQRCWQNVKQMTKLDFPNKL